MLIKFGFAGLKILPQRKKRAQRSQRLKKSRVVRPGLIFNMSYEVIWC